jgi:FAD/FMN-containing dehydrogenase
MKVVQPDGLVVKCGTKAVKSVAGYDVQKLMVGARGTLGLIAEVTLRTFPVKALPKPEVTFLSQPRPRPSNWIQRVKPSDFQAAVLANGPRLAAYDPQSSTLWAHVTPDDSLPRFEGDWVIRSGCGEKNLEFPDQTVRTLMYRTKSLFDPTGKLNRGEMGIF